MNGAQYENQQDNQQHSGQEQGAPGYAQNPSPPPFAGPTYERGSQPQGRRKSPAIATIFSCMPGMGQVYVGYYQQGFLSAVIAFAGIAMLASGFSDGMRPFIAPLLAFFWIFQMIDANRRAHHFNRAMDGLTSEEVPEGFKLPSAGGTVFGGAVMIIVGVLFILDLNFDVSLSWIKEWWPLVMIAFGANLIYKARQKAK